MSDFHQGSTLSHLAGGEEYDSVEIGEHMPLTLQPYAGGRLLGVDAVVVGKIDKRYYRYPEAVSSEIMAEMALKGFIVCPDTYLNQVVDLSNKTILLNYDRMDSNCTQTAIDEMRAIAINYGTFTTLEGALNGTMYTKFQNIRVYWYIVIAISATFIVLSICLLFFKGNAKGILDIILPNAIMVVLSAILLFVYNALGGVLMEYRLPLWYLAIMLSVGVIGVVLMFLRYKKTELTNKRISEAKKSEKI